MSSKNISIRIFFLDDENNLEKIPNARYSQLHLRKAEPEPKYAGKTVRVIEVLTSLKNGEPHAIEQILYVVREFDSSGQFDEKFMMEEKVTAMNRLSLKLDQNEFAVIEYDRVHKWKPEPDEESRLLKLIHKAIFKE